MPELGEILDILEGMEAREVFGRHGAEGAYLFGSQVSGRAAPGSDIDLAVLFGGRGDPPERFRTATSIQMELGRLLPAPLEIVVIEDADPFLAFEAVVGGKEIYRREGADLFPHEMAVRRRHEDARHIQSFYTAALKERLGI